jgi:iron complex transport system substrate-binding protein
VSETVRWIGSLALALALVGAGACSDTAGDPASPAANANAAPTEVITDADAAPATTPTTATGVASSGPRVVEHRYGSTEVPADPQRVVALSEEFLLADLLALGVTPVASGANDPDQFLGIDPALTADIELIYSPEFNLESLAALRPDLILAYPTYIDLVSYDDLAAVAPTVAIEGETSLDQFVNTAAALGLDARAATLFGEYEATLAEARQILDGTSISLLSVSPGPLLRVYTDERAGLAQVLLELGVTLRPQAADGADDNGRLTLSFEQLELLDGDTLVLLQSSIVPGEDDALDAVQSEGLWQTIPAVADGRTVVLDRFGYPGLAGSAQFAVDVAEAVAG